MKMKFEKPASQVPLVAASQGMYDLTQHPPDVPWILHVDSVGFTLSWEGHFTKKVINKKSSQKGHQQNCQDDVFVFFSLPFFRQSNTHVWRKKNRDVKIWLL